MKKKPHSSKTKRRVESALSLPSGLLGNCTKMEWTDNRQVQIDGCCGVSEYEDTHIEAATAGGSVRFWGEHLELTFLSADCILINGCLQSVEFLYT